MAINAHEFEALYRANAPDLLAYLRRRGAGEEAPDLLAETFLVAWRRRDQLPEPAWQRAWLFATARRLRLAQARRLELPTPPPPHGASTEDLELQQAVQAALGRLPATDHELLTLTIWEGLSPAEAASVLGISAGTARVRLHRARRRLAVDPGLAGQLTSRNASLAPILKAVPDPN